MLHFDTDLLIKAIDETSDNPELLAAGGIQNCPTLRIDDLMDFQHFDGNQEAWPEEIAAFLVQILADSLPESESHLLYQSGIRYDPNYDGLIVVEAGPSGKFVRIPFDTIYASGLAGFQELAAVVDAALETIGQPRAQAELI